MPTTMQTHKQTIDIEVSGSAMEAVRLSFNPAALTSVDRLKLLAAAFITECERLRDSRATTTPDLKAEAYEADVVIRTRARNAAIAIHEAESAAMWAVKAATTGK